MGEALTVVHLGPSVAEPGGIGSVIDTLSEAAVGGTPKVVATWSQRSALHRAALAAAGVGHLATMRRGNKVVHAHVAKGGSVPRKAMLLTVARLRGVPTVATIHGSSFGVFAQKRPKVTRALLRRCDVVLALSPEIEDHVRRLAPGATVARISNPVQLDADVSPAGTSPPAFVFAGEIGRRKGVDVLLAAWPAVRRAVPDATLTIIGPRTELEVPATAGVTACPPASRAEVRALMRHARAVVLPSRAEALPMALLESMAVGRPFVSTPVGHVPSLASSGGGRIVPVGDADALAEAMAELLEHPDEASRAGAAAYSYCAEHLSVDALADVLAGHYATARDRAAARRARRSRTSH